MAALVLPVIDCLLIVIESIIAACHCEFIGWNCTLILVTNLIGIAVNSAVQICGSESRLYDPKLNSYHQLRENNFTLDSRHWIRISDLKKSTFINL